MPPGRTAEAGVAAAALLAGCASATPEAAEGTRAATPGGTLPAAHIHGAVVDPGDGTLLLPIHEGLPRVGDDGEVAPIGPAIDLMGFAVAGPGRFPASGHPGAGVDLPQPVGLRESTDGGVTWEVLSRGGESDFHALTAGARGILAFDGALLSSPDGRAWDDLDIPAPPSTLTASPDGSRSLATTEQGLLGSCDGGATWVPVENAPLLQVADWATEGDLVVGIDPTGVAWTSADGGQAWQEGVRLGSAPQAVEVVVTGDEVRVVAVTRTALLDSRDAGRTFDVVLEHRVPGDPVPRAGAAPRVGSDR